MWLALLAKSSSLPPHPPSHRLNLQSNQLPSTPLQLLSSMQEVRIEAAAYIILEELQSELLRCKDGGDGRYLFIVYLRVISSCSSSLSKAAVLCI